MLKQALLNYKKPRIEIRGFFIARTGHIPERDMFNTFNMGVGMTVSVDKNDADKAVEILNNSGVEAYILGELVNSDEGVIIN